MPYHMVGHENAQSHIIGLLNRGIDLYIYTKRPGRDRKLPIPPPKSHHNNHNHKEHLNLIVIILL